MVTPGPRMLILVGTLGLVGLFGSVCAVGWWTATATRGTNRGQPVNSVESAVSAIAETDRFRRRNAVTFLATTPVDAAHRPTVLAALAGPITDGDSYIRQDARMAFARWAGPDEVPRLIELAREEDTFANAGRRAAVEALGRLKDERALPVLRELAGVPAVKREVERALKTFGEGE